MSQNKEHDLHAFMSQITTEMACEYKRIFQRTREDPGTAGDQGEENWAELLRGWLPYGYRVVTKGRLIGHDGTTTPQIDVLVLKPSYPAKLVNKKMYMAAGVAAAFECKTTLKAAHLKKAVETAVKVKDLFKPRFGTPQKELHSPIVYGVLAHSHDWKGTRSSPEDNISGGLLRHDDKFVTHPRQMLDLVCVADVGCWSRMTIAFLGPAYMSGPWQFASQYGQNGSATTAFSCAAYTTSNPPQEQSFTPIGCLIALLLQKLAWEDPTCRDMADYYRLANLWGSGAGAQRLWPDTIYSDAIRPDVVRGRLVQGGASAWSEWLMVYS